LKWRYKWRVHNEGASWRKLCILGDFEIFQEELTLVNGVVALMVVSMENIGLER